MSEERSIRDYAVVGIRTMSEDVRQQFLERLRQEQRAWDFKSNPRIPIDVFPDAFSHFYTLRFLRPLLSGDGFVNLEQLETACQDALGSEFNSEHCFSVCQSLADQMESAGVEFDYH